MAIQQPAKPYHERHTDLQLKLPLVVDFVPLLSLQTVLESDRNDEHELYYFKGHVSERLEQVSPKGGPIETDLGTIKQHNTNDEKTVVEYGSRDPEDRTGAKFKRVTHEEVFEQVRDLTAVPEVVTKRKAIAHGIPKSVADSPVLDGASAIYQEQTSHGGMVHKMRQMLQLPLANPYEIGKRSLMEYGLLDDPDRRENFRKRARSLLASEFVAPNNNRGYEDLLQSEDLLPLKRGLRAGRKWEDVAVPQEFNLPDGQTMQGRVYELDNRNEIVGIG